MKIIWGMVIAFKFAVGAVRHSGKQDNSSPITRTLDSLWRQETQTQARLPLCQHQMGKTWSLLQYSAWVFLGKKKKVQGTRHWIFYRHFSLFSSIWHRNRDKPACSPIGEAQTHSYEPITILTCQVSHITRELQSSGSHAKFTLHSRNGHYSVTHPILPAASFMGIPWQKQGWSIAAGEEQAPKGQIRWVEQVCLSSIL